MEVGISASFCIIVNVNNHSLHDLSEPHVQEGITSSIASQVIINVSTQTGQLKQSVRLLAVEALKGFLRPTQRISNFSFVGIPARDLEVYASMASGGF